MAFPTTHERVPAHTADHINWRIQRGIEQRVQRLEDAPAGISQRLKELDAEWDIERAIEANASSIAFIGTGSQVQVLFAAPAHAEGMPPRTY